jgi:hypothetical protein
MTWALEPGGGTLDVTEDLLAEDGRGSDTGGDPEAGGVHA